MAWNDDRMLERQRDYADREADSEPEQVIECACCGGNIFNHEYAYELTDGWWCESCVKESKHSTDTLE